VEEPAGQEPDVSLVLSHPVSEHLQREQHARRSGQTPETWDLEDRRGLRVISSEEALDRVVQPAGRQPELLRHLSRRLVDRRLRLEHAVDVARRAPRIESERDRSATHHVHLPLNPAAFERLAERRERGDDLGTIHPVKPVGARPRR